MRLIDADLLIERIGFYNTSQEREENVGQIITLEDFDNMQTAYDIDKVVDELEMEMKASSGYSAERVSAFSRAIEIVKQGGVRKDVCEWNGEQSRLVTFTRFTTDCGDNIDLQTNSELLKEFRYCPFCGKKIKVVE